MNAKNAGSQLKKKKVKKKSGSVQAPIAATSTPSQKTEKAKSTLKLPSKYELTKNPMKYLGEAVKTFQALAQQVELQGEAIVKIANHMQDSDEKLAPLITAIEQAKIARTQNQASGTTVPANPQGQNAMGFIMQLLPALMGGGGGDSELSKELMRMSIDRMKADIGFTEAIKTAIVSKLAGKAAADLV